jgi:single-strand DNA-binding protein
MKTITIAGNTGKDAEHKSTQAGQELCSFSVAVDDGFGDNKTTMWFDVTRWGKGADGLARVLRKGSKVAVSGELSTRVHDGKTYLQVRADKVTILSTPKGEDSRSEMRREIDDAPEYDDANQIPF